MPPRKLKPYKPPSAPIGTWEWLKECEERSLDRMIEAHRSEGAGSQRHASGTETTTAAQQGEMMRLFVDMDGVLADFDRHHEAVFGIRACKIADNVDWERVRAVRNFYLG